jgi:hypothetical protein
MAKGGRRGGDREGEGVEGDIAGCTGERAMVGMDKIGRSGGEAKLIPQMDEYV